MGLDIIDMAGRLACADSGADLGPGLLPAAIDNRAGMSDRALLEMRVEVREQRAFRRASECLDDDSRARGERDRGGRPQLVDLSADETLPFPSHGLDLADFGRVGIERRMTNVAPGDLAHLLCSAWHTSGQAARNPYQKYGPGKGQRERSKR